MPDSFHKIFGMPDSFQITKLIDFVGLRQNGSIAKLAPILCLHNVGHQYILSNHQMFNSGRPTLVKGIDHCLG